MTTRNELAKLIDHTNLKAWATSSDIDKLCQEAIDYGFYSVCVYGYWVTYIKENYPTLKISQVVNFPDGLSSSHTSTLASLENDADEYDMVLNLSKLKERQTDSLEEDIRTVKTFIGSKPLKVIVETAVLTMDDLYTAIRILHKGGADFIKTSTGMVIQSEESLLDQVDTISSYLKLYQIPLKIKASGGVRNLHQVKVLVGLGVSRIGCSNSISIINELGENR